MLGDQSRGYTMGVSAAHFDSLGFGDLKELYACSLAQRRDLEQAFVYRLDAAENLDELHHDLAALRSSPWANHEDPDIVMARLAGSVEPWLLCAEQLPELLPRPPGLELPSDNSSSVTVIDSDEDTTSSTFHEHALYEDCRWHESSHSVGVVSGDGHIFTNTAGAGKVGRGRQGGTLKLGSLCMVFEHNLRRGGQHQYNYAILGGDLGAADGAGFVFDSKLRRSNIQRMRSVFLNRRGQLCVRDQQKVTRLGARLPEFSPGVIVVLVVDLDSLWLHFTVYLPDGSIGGTADVSAAGLFGSYVPDAGFFCAVVTKDVTVALT